MTLAFAAALLLWLAVRLWLSTRQMRHVAAHRDRVPPAFAASVTLAAHQRAADYTLAKGRFEMFSMAFGTAVLVGWTLLGGLDALNAALRDAVLPRAGAMAYQLSLLVAFVVEQIELVDQAFLLEDLKSSVNSHAIDARIAFLGEFVELVGVEVDVRLVDQLKQQLALSREPDAVLSQWSSNG